MSCAKNSSSGGGSKARRRISFNNVFRRSSSANSNAANSLQTATASRRRQDDGDCRSNPSSHSEGTDATAVSMVSGAFDGKPQARPRRSSLKKTSSYTVSSDSTDQTDANGTEHKAEQRQTKARRATSTNKRRPSVRRRRSTTDIPSSSAATNQILSSSNSSASLTANRRRRPSVQFDNCVSFATVPTMVEVIEQGGSEADLYYTNEEFFRMKRAIRQDARQIKEERSNLGMDTKTCSTLANASVDDSDIMTNPPPCQPRQDESDLNDWGIEHHTCTRSARAERAQRVSHVIQSVLREQETQCLDPESGLLTEASVQNLARTSALASRTARAQAQRRGSDVERHCRRWSGTAAGATSNAATTTHTTTTDIATVTTVANTDDSIGGPATCDFEGLSDSDDDDSCNGGGDDEVLSVADASLDESAPRVKSYTRHRRSSS